jgi:cytochrome c oxidase cbb3-type subunit II
MKLFEKHAIFEKNSILLTVAILIVVAIGGIVEIVPLFYLKSTIEKVEGMRPYTPLELAGRNIYVREGCYLCHSQMVRPMRDEIERYGHFSLAAESQYDHPFQWGSKRTGPDLARVGGKYSDEWHVAHLENPRAVVPASIMPGYGFLSQTPINGARIAEDMKVLAIAGTPYNEDMIRNARADFAAQVNPDGDVEAFLERYPKSVVRDFDGNPARITEMDALVAYLQMLGTLVDYSIYDDKANLR